MSRRDEAGGDMAADLPDDDVKDFAESAGAPSVSRKSLSNELAERILRSYGFTFILLGQSLEATDQRRCL
jgi:hypothetical protein